MRAFPRTLETVPQNTSVARDPRGRFQPGSSGNPGGRKPGIADLIRKRTKDGRVLVDRLLEVLEEPTQSMRDRLRATEVLLSYGFSKPLAEVDDGDGDDRIDVRVIQRIIARVEGTAQP